MKYLDDTWKPNLHSILTPYVDRLPGSFLEEKEYSVALHYRDADPDQASVRTKELMDNLMHFTGNTDLRVLQGNKVIEIRNSGMNKGTAVQYFLESREYDFVLAIGDDSTDEDMFKVIPSDGYSIKVALEPSRAQRYLRTHADVRALMKDFVAIATNFIFVVTGLCVT